MIRALRTAAEALADAVRLARPYFSSEERHTAYGLLIAIVALNLVTVYLNVVYTYWYKVAYDALQTKTPAVFWEAMFSYRSVHGFPYFVPGFFEIAAASILAAVYAYYLSQMLEIRWRRWLTVSFVGDWLDRRAYYHISLEAAAGTPLDNPDQRIADDLPLFVSSNLTLGISLLTNVVTLLSFIGVLWSIAPPLRLGHFVVPGYLVWAALVYSIAGTGLTQLIGRRLIPLTFKQQQVNADFRFGLVRVRENTEQIALYRGEEAECSSLFERFEAIYRNWWSIMKRTKALNFFTIGFTQIALIFPLVVAAPGYFTGTFTLGVLMQIVTIFGNVQGALSWFVSSYPDLVAWRATVQRLDGFERAVHKARLHAALPALSMTAGASALRANGLEIDLPDGRPLLKAERLQIERGDPIAVIGASGAGKSTLFRVLAGIWPFARGHIAAPAGRQMFLPQRPYMPLGSLRRAVMYPLNTGAVADRIVCDALESVGLGALAAQLDVTDNWALRLSGGEQQRLALARVLVVRPAWVFLDEALSALDERAAAALYALLRERLPETQIVSITHSQAMQDRHERHIEVARGSVSAPPVTLPVS